MKKILVVIPSFEVGGTISSLYAIIAYLQKKYIIDVYALSHDNIEKQSLACNILKRNLFVHSYSCNFKNSKGFLKILVILIKLLKHLCLKLGINIEKRIYGIGARCLSNKYDCVVGFQEGNATLFASLVAAPKKIAWVHCDYMNYPQSGHELHIYDKYENIICVSKYTSDRFKQVYPMLSNRVSYIYNLIDFDRIQSGSLAEIDDPIFKSDKFTIISIGRLHAVKRFEYIPDIAKQLVDNNCEFRWYILGPHFSDSIYTELVESISEKSLSEHVFYIGNKSNPYPYLLQSDLLVSLSVTEACPMIFNEAKVLGVPILTTDFGSAIEFIDNDNGLIEPFEKIASALIDLINTSEQLESTKCILDKIDYNKTIKDSLDQVFA